MNKYQQALDDVKRYKANSHRLGECKPLRSQLATLQELVDLQPRETLTTLVNDLKGLYSAIIETIDKLDEKDRIEDGECLLAGAAALRNTADIYIAILNETTKNLLEEEIDRRMNVSENIPTTSKA